MNAFRLPGHPFLRSFPRAAGNRTRADIQVSYVLGVPQKMVFDGRVALTDAERLIFDRSEVADKVVRPEHFVHHTPHPMQILVADLHEDASGIRQKFLRHASRSRR